MSFVCFWGDLFYIAQSIRKSFAWQQWSHAFLVRGFGCALFVSLLDEAKEQICRRAETQIRNDYEFERFF